MSDPFQGEHIDDLLEKMAEAGVEGSVLIDTGQRTKDWRVSPLSDGELCDYVGLEDYELEDLKKDLGYVRIKRHPTGPDTINEKPVEVEAHVLRQLILAYESRTFRTMFEVMQRRVHRTARAKGWWDTPREDGTLIALMHSELSEALEHLRKPGKQDEHCPEFSGLEIELADTIIRIMDFAHASNLRLAEAIEAKAAFNEGREMKHGGKHF